MSRVAETFLQFLYLGCISFGGPSAHIGYFHTAFVQKLKWIDEDAYSRIVALSQFLPGPGSSQVGFALGYRRAGLFGGIAAFIGFTLPSFLILYFVAVYEPEKTSTTLFSDVIYGLKLLAVVVVADACYKMYKSFCTSRLASTIAILSSAIILIVPSIWTQIFVLLCGGAAGLFLQQEQAKNTTKNLKVLPNWRPLILFFLLLLMLPALASTSLHVEIFSNFYHAGSFVFGGGHVVLPLLDQTIGNSLTNDQFLTGYASAQGVPGPMFSLAAYLGAALLPNHQLLGAVIATLAIFMPGFLLILGLQDTWETFASRPKISNVAIGINAAVVGLLIAALYNPVFVSAVSNRIDCALIIIGLLCLNILRLPIAILVAGFIAVGVTQYLII